MFGVRVGFDFTQVHGKEVEGTFVLFVDFAGSYEREVCSVDKVGPCGCDQVLICVDAKVVEWGHEGYWYGIGEGWGGVYVKFLQ